MAMDVIVLDPVATTAFGVACFSAGGLVTAAVLAFRQHRRADSDVAPAIAPALDDTLSRMAERWASARGTPGLSRWAHHRLRSLVRAGQRPPDPPSSSWRARS